MGFEQRAQCFDAHAQVENAVGEVSTNGGEHFSAQSVGRLHPALFRLPRRLYGAERSTRRIGGSQFGECQALAKDRGGSERESSSVRKLASVEPESLLIEVAEQMKRFDRHVGAAQHALQKAPIVLQSVGVNGANGVGVGVVDHLVNVFPLKTDV